MKMYGVKECLSYTIHDTLENKKDRKTKVNVLMWFN